MTSFVNAPSTVYYCPKICNQVKVYLTKFRSIKTIAARINVFPTNQCQPLCYCFGNEHSFSVSKNEIYISFSNDK